MTPENTLYSIISLFETYQKNTSGIHIQPDDCRILAEKLKELVKIYNIKNNVNK